MSFLKIAIIKLSLETDWHDFERYRVAEKIMAEFPDLSVSRLFGAIRVCGDEVKRYEGVDKLAERTKQYLRKDAATGFAPGNFSN